MTEKNYCNLRQKTACFLFAYKKIRKHVPISSIKNVEVTFVTKNNYEKNIFGVEYDVLIDTHKFSYDIVLFQALGQKTYQIKKIKKHDHNGAFAVFIKTLTSFFQFVARYFSVVLKSILHRRKSKGDVSEDHNVEISNTGGTSDKKKKRKDICEMMEEESTV